MLLTKITAAQNLVAINYHRKRGLYFLAVVFVRSIICPVIKKHELWLTVDIMRELIRLR